VQPVTSIFVNILDLLEGLVRNVLSVVCMIEKMKRKVFLRSYSVLADLWTNELAIQEARMRAMEEYIARRPTGMNLITRTRLIF